MYFIYVRNEQDKNKMIALDYTLMKEDKRNNMWVFQNKDIRSFACEEEISSAGIQFVLSNTLTF